ncbi:KpsF/GutQ family sugar-phosphate isomerase [Novispirillum sp. DQ9]|uniref:KpsF/GutQ family sugar-phosphate isomerase n=1 Tax=Novispirillum sp. DQ9 TaxID=3398612 RepID=UPI003C7E8DB0
MAPASDTPAPAQGPTPAVIAARRTLALEADALRALADSLDGAFTAAVESLAAITGRVVVSGMGKSGHVARKIAATLASTGTPAFFVHPGEASHGDLGMVTRDDAVVALSNSGETPELADIIAYTRRFAIPLVGMTGRPGSTLAQASDHALVLPPAAEACPLGLAPTTSTTMMLALGDALAVALLERNGFTAADFRVFHPGGKLGQRLLKVADLMHRSDELPLVSPDTPMSEALVVMSGRGFGSLGIVDDAGALIGIVTDGDLRRHMAPDLLAQPVGRVMTANPRVVEPTQLAAEALQIMNARKITTFFVVADGRPVGLLHIHDLLRAGVA